jgi:hypothetical protein
LAELYAPECFADGESGYLKALFELVSRTIKILHHFYFKRCLN